MLRIFSVRAVLSDLFYDIFTRRALESHHRIDGMRRQWRLWPKVGAEARNDDAASGIGIGVR